MFTQSPQQVLKSPIAYAIISQTATKIFLPNPEADYDDYVNGFKLTHREYEIVKGLGEKSRRFLIK
jgi:type IV secretion system protein VirB4